MNTQRLIQCSLENMKKHIRPPVSELAPSAPSRPRNRDRDHGATKELLGPSRNRGLHSSKGARNASPFCPSRSFLKWLRRPKGPSAGRTPSNPGGCVQVGVHRWPITVLTTFDSRSSIS
ncbi:hypothetical protein PGTUg99_012861 [Puccinia graminis f. sp. tritici]|uniref:Uncharacterized protein n=1 Tax=Puccinia graminis f. sp. tritici TaxID=56615 RepID=A0A5B0S5U5_PUCGR|nr:hypothetical protein PGTUg99_012861 [Puccinia graminis f. sp. tritici]